MSDKYVAKVPGLFSLKEQVDVTRISDGVELRTTDLIPTPPKPERQRQLIDRGTWYPGMEVWEALGDAARWPQPFGDDDLDQAHPEWEDVYPNEGFGD